MSVCQHCEQRPAVVCDECRRALALLDHPIGFGSIARHPETGTDCRLGERGAASLCVECLCQGVLDARANPDGPYAAPSLEDFAAQAERAAADRQRAAELNEQLGEASAAVSMYDERPADRGPSWYRLVDGR